MPAVPSPYECRATAGRGCPPAGLHSQHVSSMSPLKLAAQFAKLYDAGLSLASTGDAQGVLLLVDEPLDWAELKKRAGSQLVVVAGDNQEQVHGAKEAGLPTVVVDQAHSAVYDRLSQALLEAVADEILSPGARVVALYGLFEAGAIDSLSLVQLSEHLGRLTVRDLQKLETSVPLDTLQTVVNLAIEIGREGREGKPVGTMFVVGDHRKVLRMSHPQGFDPVRGYSRKDRNLKSAKVREGIKEIAQLDGAFIISADGMVVASCHYLDASAKDVTLSKGLGARHWAAAAISRATKAIAVTVSESSGTVRLFQNGEVVLRIEPGRRPIKWKEFEFEKPEAS